MSAHSLILLCALGTVPLFGQNNAVIDAFLGREAADFPTTAYLVLVGCGLAPESTTIEAATQRALDEWGLPAAVSQKPVTAGTLSLLLMRGLRTRGGLLFSLVGGSWYAHKEAVWRGWYPPGYSAFRVLKSWEVIQVLNTALQDTAGEER